MNADIVRDVFFYDPETGLFRWRVKRPGKVIGQAAGCLDGCGYIVIGVFKKLYGAHNLAWLYEYGNFPIHGIDHINGIRCDNRIINLRDVPVEINQRNMKVRRNYCGYTGISWDIPYNRYKVRINYDGRRRVVGHSKNLEEAIQMRKDAELAHGYTERHGMETGE